MAQAQGGGGGANLNQGQIEAIVAAVAAAGRGRGGGKKVSLYSEATPASWLVWKKHFQVVATINEWNDERQRRELAASMEGQAGRLVRGIAVDQVPAVNINQLLQQFEEKFMPAVESDLAVATFESAQQLADETPIVWSARCSELYLRAYPNGDPNSRILINRFTVGLIDREIASFVHEQRPQTYANATTAAQTKTASKMFIQAQWKGGGGRAKGGLNAIGDGITAVAKKKKVTNGRCFFCGEKGHLRRDCEEYQKSEAAAKQRRGNVRNERKKKGGSRPPSNAAIGDPEAAEAESVEKGNC